MNNTKILQQAIELLKEVNPVDLETVQINHTKFDDGSVGFNVELTYPASEFEEVIRDGNGNVIDVERR